MARAAKHKENLVRTAMRLFRRQGYAADSADSRKFLPDGPCGRCRPYDPIPRLEGEIEQAVALWERARTMASFVRPDCIMLSHYYESAGRHEDAQAIVQELLAVQPEMTAELGVERLARLWNEEWIPEDLEA